MSIKLVIARYNEDTSWVKDLKVDYLINNKGPEDLGEKSVRIPAKRREAYSYLHFITANYDKLPDFVAFCHGRPFDHCSNFLYLLNNFKGDREFFPLSNTQISENHRVRNGIHIIHEVFFDEPMGVLNFWVAQQFIVAKERILFRPKYMYDECLNLSETSSCSDIVASFDGIMERLFPKILDGTTPSKIRKSN